jgi:uncharacterized protein YbjT (DUF2867 family)
MKLSVILTGATGMVGEGVLHECILHPDVEKILIINRKASGTVHPKVKEIIHQDFFHLSSLRQELAGYNTCFFCLGVSSVGMDKKTYFNLTYNLTLNFAKTLADQNPAMVFCYISGAGTDSSEKGRIAWARVKGKTENDLMKLSFKSVYNFRPAMLESTPGLKNTLSYYKYFKWMIPIIKLVAPNAISTLNELGLAMIKVSRDGYPKHIIDVKDIHALAKQ